MSMCYAVVLCFVDVCQDIYLLSNVLLACPILLSSDLFYILDNCLLHA